MEEWYVYLEVRMFKHPDCGCREVKAVSAGIYIVGLDIKLGAPNIVLLQSTDEYTMWVLE